MTERDRHDAECKLEHARELVAKLAHTRDSMETLALKYQARGLTLDVWRLLGRDGDPDEP